MNTKPWPPKVIIKNKKFRILRNLSRAFIIKDLNNWLSFDPEEESDIKKVKKLSDADFEDLTEQLLFYETYVILHLEINRILSLRLSEYLNWWKEEILSFRDTAFNVNEENLARMISMTHIEVESILSKTWKRVDILVPESYKFEETLAVLSKIQRTANKKSSLKIKVRRDIIATVSNAIGVIKEMQKVRYGKEYRTEYNAFIKKYFLDHKKRNLTKFLTGTKVCADVAEFDELRRRNLRTSRNTRKK